MQNALLEASLETAADTSGPGVNTTDVAPDAVAAESGHNDLQDATEDPDDQEAEEEETAEADVCTEDVE